MWPRTKRDTPDKLAYAKCLTLFLSPRNRHSTTCELALQFLKLVLPSEGEYFVGVKTKRGKWDDKRHQPTIEALCAYLFEADRDGSDAYFAVASFTSNDSRKAENVRALRAFRIEIDYGEGHSSKDIYATKADALKALDSFCDAVGLPAPMVVESGGGLHIYWPLKDAIEVSEWKRCSEGLKAACHAHGLKAGHECTADAARVLRLPGTTNRKIPGQAETGHAGPAISQGRAVRSRAVRYAARVRAAADDQQGPVPPAAQARTTSTASATPTHSPTLPSSSSRSKRSQPSAE